MDRTALQAGAISPFADLQDDELIDQVKDLVARERRATVALIRALVEFDTRKLYLREGCSSLYTYCTHVLHLSEGSAYNRIETARAAQRYPEILEALDQGAVTLTAIRLLAPHLTPENHVDVLRAARHKSKLEIQELTAALNPRPAAATIVRPTSVVTPLSPDTYKLQVTLNRDTYQKLRRVQALARHTVPNGNLGSILDRALTLLIADIERQKCARTATPRPKRPARLPSGRHIPAAVKRAVWERDDGRCAFAGRAGRCRETAFLEFHHVEPYAMGGPSTVDNIQLRCRAHNQHEARVFFGDILVPLGTERFPRGLDSDAYKYDLLDASRRCRLPPDP